MSSKTVQALELVDSNQMTAYAAAKHCKIALSTIYRAIKRRDNPPVQATHATPAPFPVKAGLFIPPRSLAGRVQSSAVGAGSNPAVESRLNAEAAELGLVRTAGESDESLGARIEQLKRLRAM